MTIRLLIVLTLLVACSSGGQSVSKTLEVSSARLAETKSKPYIGGNGPGGFSAAALSNYGDGSDSIGIAFTGFGPYLHEMGFAPNMMITEIDGRDINEIFAERWKGLRLKAPDAFDAAHYKDLIEYLFAKEPGESVVVTLHVARSPEDLLAGRTPEPTQTWRIVFLR